MTVDDRTMTLTTDCLSAPGSHVHFTPLRDIFNWCVALGRENALPGNTMYKMFPRCGAFFDFMFHHVVVIIISNLGMSFVLRCWGVPSTDIFALGI